MKYEVDTWARQENRGLCVDEGQPDLGVSPAGVLRQMQSRERSGTFWALHVPKDMMLAQSSR